MYVLSRRLPYPQTHKHTHVRTHAYTNIRPDDINKAAMNARKNLIWKMKSGIYTKHSANMNGRERERGERGQREPKTKQTSEVKELTRTRECSPPTSDSKKRKMPNMRSSNNKIEFPEKMRKFAGWGKNLELKKIKCQRKMSTQ